MQPQYILSWNSNRFREQGKGFSFFLGNGSFKISVIKVCCARTQDSKNRRKKENETIILQD